MSETAKDAARRLAAPMLYKGFKPEALHHYRDAAGKVVYSRIRAKHPDTGEKWIRPMHSNGSGYKLGEPHFNGPKPLYNLHRLTKYPDAHVFIVEGEKAADALAHALPEVVATTSGGAQSTDRTDWTPLKGRNCIIWRDRDDAGIKYAEDVARILVPLGCAVAWLDVDVLGLPEKGDAADWMAAHPNAAPDELLALPVAEAPLGAQPAEVSEAQPAPEKRASAIVAGEWPIPSPLPDGLSKVEPFTSELLPESIRPWVEDIGERTQAPADYLGVSAMVALGAVIGRQVGIRPQAESDWIEFANLWGCLVGRPSTMKTPSMEAVLAPVMRLQTEAAKRHAAELEDYERQLRVVKLKQDAGEKEARKKLATSMNADLSQCFAVEEPEKPLAKRYIANDTSYQQLGELLLGNPNGLCVYRDELVSLLKSLDREDNAEARGFYLSSWSGKQGYAFDRISRKGANLDAVCISMLGSTQPGRIASYVRTAVKGGDGDDGLLQRFGLIVWPDVGAEWRNVDRWPDTAARRTAWETFARLDAIDLEKIGAEWERGLDGEPEGQPYLRLDPEALAMFRDWHARLEERLRGEQEAPALESHFTKYKKLIPALALILHLAAGGQGRVTRAPMLQALAWNDYLESHARRVYASLTNPENAAAKAIVAKLRSSELSEQFGAREIYRRGWAHLSDRETVQDALELLADLNWVSKVIVAAEGGQGRFATIYHANPRGLA